MRVFITGAAGALGRALIERLIRDDRLTRLVCYSRSESRQAEVARRYTHPALRWVLGDVRDTGRMAHVMRGCESVIHAAALKRVDAMAYNPSELRKTNIDGSANVIEAALEAGVTRILMISSDKAVWPQNAYGVSKAAMEAEAIASNSHTVPRGLRVACTRWGNVLGSTGSVVGIWLRAIDAGEPIQITDPEMTRFWLTLDDAAGFALASLSALRGGEIFLPILPAMRIGDLADALAPGHPRVIVGPRAGGEKRHEVLMTDEESTRAVYPGDFKGIVINPGIHSWRSAPPWSGERWMQSDTYRSDVVGRVSIAEMRGWLSRLASEGGAG